MDMVCSFRETKAMLDKIELSLLKTSTLFVGPKISPKPSHGLTTQSKPTLNSVTSEIFQFSKLISAVSEKISANSSLFSAVFLSSETFDSDLL